MADPLLDLTRRYLEPHRRYHGVHHIAHMLAAGAEPGLDDGQIMAIWFHDAIYDPRSKTNEADSAALATSRLLAAGWPAAAAQRVHDIVLATKDHRPTVAGSELVLDLDLMSLALPWPEFTRNTADIRAEYAHVPDAEFSAGRAAFFRAMLQRDRLFHTAFGTRFEAAARANLRQAIGAA
ncbi:MAG: metal-dependent phosphohydrolase, partial [Planctomycetes bacterium]|nr:metal-dependent phosphohydrolase [Planctomycetota bacterium]